MAGRMPHVVSVILNTNRREDTLACLASLQANDYPNHTALVLDNASTDGSVEAIRAQFPSVQVLALAENRGYAGNNNVGIAAALAQGADWVFVLNEDTILAPDCLRQLMAVAEGDDTDDDTIGIVGPLVLHHDEPTVIQSAGGALGRDWQARHLGQNQPDAGQFREPRPVDWISGCAILVRRAVIEQVGMLDERFFYYWEETEWCLRARRAGWQVVHVPQARLWHKGVQRDYRPSPSVTYYNTRNRLLMMAKHRAPLRAWLIVWFQLVRTLLSWSLRPKWRRVQQEHRTALWRGAFDFLRRRWGMRPA
ncbi:glycosyltransferase family 2 protein [Litorilinea aerophila]|uniref:Glycosyltransferase family 2 protein n=1 Tax=Litorilinea aerophila TaxID=1204385 RepID=A0A540VFI7_9CHLR|nr:glycosyltransferase family 2 protein [Litorilinea aerophila]MCC9076784.1 glycosyltransferase family 2 protein [Litorilinea aerophila]GIV76515.1 MAG: glycosyl transferase [Litorilinea sp.]